MSTQNNFPSWPDDGEEILQSNQPGYVSAFSGFQWQSNDIEEVIRLLNELEPAGKYNCFRTFYSVPSKMRIILPGAQRPVPLSESKTIDPRKTDSFQKTIKTTGILYPKNKPVRELRIYIVTSRDGDGLRKYFNMATPKPEDLIFFLEDNTDDISEAVLLCKMGKTWNSYFKTHMEISVERIDMVKRVASSLGVDYKLFDLIKTGEIKGYPWLDKADKAGKIVFYLAEMGNYVICIAMEALLESMISGIEKLKIPSSGWLPDDEHPEEFEPALMSKGAGQLMEVTADAVISMVEGCAQMLKDLDNFIDTISKSSLITNDFVRELIEAFLKKAKAFIALLSSALDSLKEILESVKHLGIIAMNAFFCGITNGFIDAVAGILKLIKWVFSMGEASGDMLLDIKNKLPPALELIDNLTEAWNHFKFKDFFSALKKQFARFLAAVINDLAAGLTQKNVYQIAYFTGNIVGFVIELLLEIMVTGGTAAVLKFFDGIGQAGVKITEAVTRLAKSVLEISLEDTVKDIALGLRMAIRFFAATKEQLAEFFAKLFEELKVIFGIGFKDSTEEIFEKFGLTWKSRLIPRLNSGLPSADVVYDFVHNGIQVFRGGSKKELEEFAEKLKGMGDDAAKKYLDDLVETLNKYKTPTEFDLTKIEDLRKIYHPRSTRNVAFCKGEIGGVKTNLECVSGGEKSPWKQKGNFEPPKPQEYHFKNGPKPEILLDTEQKIFEYLYKKFSHNKNIVGEIEIVTDLKFCKNCSWIIKEFQKEFPNIRIIKTFIKEKL